MTVSTTASREQYATDGVTTAFTIHFPFFDDTDVNAILTAAGGASTVLALSTDFTVSGGGGSGGTLALSIAPAAGGTLTIYRDIAFTQEDDYVEDDPLPAATLEGGFDRAAMRDQQLQDAASRSLSFPVTVSPAVSAELPAPAANQYLAWNSGGDALENRALAAGTTVYSSIATTRAGVSQAESVTPDGLASLWQQGADIASAATLVKPSDSNLGGYHVITGTVAVSALWAGTKAGEEYEFEAAAALPLTHGANFQLLTGASINCVAGDRFRVRYFGSNVWKMVGFHRADGTALAQPASVELVPENRTGC